MKLSELKKKPLTIEEDGRLFKLSLLSLPVGQLFSYRENCSENSMHVRVYDNRWTVHCDRYNPEYSLWGAIQHLVLEVPYLLLPIWWLYKAVR